MKQLFVSSDIVQLAQAAEQWLSRCIVDHQRDSQRRFSLALAGGSTPKALYELLAKNWQASGIDWTRVLFLWGDERNVPADHVDSNFRMAQEALLSSLPLQSEQVLRIPTTGQNVELVAAEYERVLRNHLKQLNGKFGMIDCVLLGMGDDVHTASLFPETTALDEDEKWIVANYVPKLATWRVTMTAPLINAAKNVAFFISGASKTKALAKLWHGPYDPRNYPSQLIQPTDGQLVFFVDRPAIADISIPTEFRIAK